MKVNAEQAERLHRFAHDLRNRLIGLHQALEQLRQTPSEGDRDEFALFGEQQYFKALREVESVLDDLGVERGATKPVTEPVDLGDLVRKHAENLRFRYERKQQPFIFELADRITVQADPRMLGDIVEALLSNASKFSRAGQPIRVRTHVDGAEAVMDVQDNGTGLSKEDLDQVFVRFAWLSNRPTAGEAQGRGTLARARQWASAHGGSLEAQSPGVDQGCTFTLRVPLFS